MACRKIRETTMSPETIRRRPAATLGDPLQRWVVFDEISSLFALNQCTNIPVRGKVVILTKVLFCEIKFRKIVERVP